MVEAEFAVRAPSFQDSERSIFWTINKPSRQSDNWLHFVIGVLGAVYTVFAYLGERVGRNRAADVAQQEIHDTFEG